MGYDTLTPGDSYFIVVGENGQFDTSADLLSLGGNDYELTVQNTGQGSNPDLNDSDAFLIMDNSVVFNGFPVDTITIGPGGFVDHTLDFGFTPYTTPTPTNPPSSPKPTDSCSTNICLPITVTIKRY